MQFSIEFPAKCIIAGEHAVVRGKPAIVFPLRQKCLRLSYRESASLEIVSETIPQAAISAALAATNSSVRGSIVITISEIFSCAKKMEDVFHGNSSGLDLASILQNHPILFQKGKNPKALSLAWTPKFYLLDSGTRSDTKSAVDQVQAMQNFPLDMAMEAAVLKVQDALAKDEAEGLSLLTEAFKE